MSKKETIRNRFKYIRGLFISLVFVVILFNVIRELHMYNSSVTFFERELLEYRSNEIEIEISNRQDEIEAIQDKVDDEFQDELRQKVEQIDYFALESVGKLDPSASLLEKRNAYIDTIYQYDVSEEDYLFFSLSLDGESWLMGLDKSDEHTDITFLQDPVDGSYFIVDMIDIVTNSENNDGFITYHWPKVVGGEPMEKTTYLYYNEEVELLIGTGLYLDDYQSSVIDELSQRILDYYENTDDYFFIIGFDGTIHAQTDFSHFGASMSELKDSEGNNFHETVVNTLSTNDSAWITLIGVAEDGDCHHLTYVSVIEEWDMYIGKSLNSDVIEVLNEEYANDALRSAIITIVSISIILISTIYVIRKNMNINFGDVQKEFNEQANEIKRASLIDSLTGLYNRKYFDTAIVEMKKEEISHINVIMGDANGLKLTNDAYGHEFGDQLLQSIASVLKEVFQEASIFRWGGDEFLVLTYDRTDEEMAADLNEFNKLAKQKKVGKVDISISFGHAKGNKDEDPYKIINRAEKMMYESKTFESASTKRTIIDNILDSLYGSFNFEKTHSTNVKEYSMKIAAELKFNQLETNRLRLGSLMHDIGKIGLPDYILTKSGKLTDDEYEEVKKHPEKGFRILSAYPELSEYGYIVLHHHEKYDGTGYPKGLEGEEIPLHSRIITIADAYDAMTGDRHYRESLSKQEAIDEMIRCKGTHFDPKLVEIFVGILKQE